MEQLADDHVPRVYPDDRYSSNTWGPLPPRSYFRFDPVAIECERESWETLGAPAASPPEAEARRERSKGYTVPRTPEGRSSLVPYPPWHYVGEFLVIEYWADPAAVAFLPEGIEPHPDPGRCAFVAPTGSRARRAATSSSTRRAPSTRRCSSSSTALLDGEEVTICPYIWVDRDFALARGWIQGFPKKLGSIWITRTFGLGGPADPGMEPGARFGATCAAYERRVAEATVTLEHPSEGGPTHNDPPIVNVRHFPRLAAGRHDDPAVHELVRARVARPRDLGGLGGQRRRSSSTARGTRSTTALAPVRIGKGYRFTFALHRRRPRDGRGAAAGDRSRSSRAAAPGIGAAVARRLAADGYAVAVTGRRDGADRGRRRRARRARARRRHRRRRRCRARRRRRRSTRFGGLDALV